MKDSNIDALLSAERLVLSSDKDINTKGFDTVYHLLSTINPSWEVLTPYGVSVSEGENRHISTSMWLRSYGTSFNIPALAEPLIVIAGKTTATSPHNIDQEHYIAGLVYDGQVQARSYVCLMEKNNLVERIFTLAEKVVNTHP